jgi:hypothetical protein
MSKRILISILSCLVILFSLIVALRWSIAANSCAVCNPRQLCYDAPEAGEVRSS